MTRLNSKPIHSLILCLIILVFGCRPIPEVEGDNKSSEVPNPFILGLFAGDDTIDNFDSSNPLVNYLSEELGVEVKIKTSTSYTAVIEAMKAQRIHAMQVGAFSYCLAAKQAGAKVLAAALQAESYDQDLNPFYFSVIISKKGNGIRRIEDLKGKMITFVDPASTSGNLMPKSILLSAGFDLKKDIQQRYAGSHPASVLAVMNGYVDAGATYEVALQKRLQQEKGDGFTLYDDGLVHKLRNRAELDDLYTKAEEGELVIIAQSEPIPNTPFAIRGNLSEAVKQKIKRALLKYRYTPSEEQKAKGQLTKWYLDPADRLNLESTDSFYDRLRKAAETVLEVEVEINK